MQDNPLLFGFLVLAGIFTIAIVVLAVLQRRLLADQRRAVQELLAEARSLAADGDEPSGDEEAGSGD